MTARFTEAQLSALQSGKEIPVSESSVLQSCLKILCAWGCDVVRCNTGMAFREYPLKGTGKMKRYYIRFGKKGMGDILAISPAGRWIEIETKTAKGELREAQERRRDDVRAKRGYYAVIRSAADLDKRKDEILATAW